MSCMCQNANHAGVCLATAHLQVEYDRERPTPTEMQGRTIEVSEDARDALAPALHTVTKAACRQHPNLQRDGSRRFLKVKLHATETVFLKYSCNT